MIKKLLARIALRFYIDRDMEIVHLTDEEAISKYCLSSQPETISVIKSLMTDMMIKYFDAKSDEERNILKGGVIMLKTIKDRNKVAMYIRDNVKDKDKALKMWKQSN